MSHAYLTRAEVAARYPISESFLEKAAMRNPRYDGPPLIRLTSRKVVYRACDVEEWLDSYLAEPPRRRGRPTNAERRRREMADARR